MNAKALKQKYGFEHPFITDPLARKTVWYTGGDGKLLDIGCGEGADSVFYSRHGLIVTSIDKEKTYLDRFGAYRRDHGLSGITIRKRSVLTYEYPPNAYDVISCILVLCCMKQSQFGKILGPIKRSVKRGGIIAVSSRNYLDPEYRDYRKTGEMVEPNTFRKKEDCCRFLYFIEKNRLREMFSDFEILYYHEGFAPCKYGEHPKHGDSSIICRRIK